MKVKQERMAPEHAGTHKWAQVPPAENTQVCVPHTLVPSHTHTPVYVHIIRTHKQTRILPLGLDLALHPLYVSSPCTRVFLTRAFPQGHAHGRVCT